MKTNLICAGVLLASGCALAAVPTVSNVSVAQNDETRLVTITYDLDAEAIVLAEILTNGAAIGWSQQGQLAGAVNRKVAAGTGRQIWWRPDRTWPEGGKIVEGTVTARVTAYPADNPPDYLVADLTGTKQMFYYPCEAALPGGISNRLYRTERIVFRKIPAAGATFRLGLPWYGDTGYGEGKNHPRRVTLTNDFYLGVFPLTQGQAATAMKLYSTPNFKPGEIADPSYSGPDAELCPRDVLSSKNIGFGYPTRTGINDFSLDASGVLGSIRSLLGISNVITPTIAEWEFACQAGSEEPVYGGYSMDEVAWYATNSCDRVHPVGLKKPNAFGLYDMLGNVNERTRESASFGAAFESVAPFVAEQSHGGYLALLGGSFKAPRVNYEILEIGTVDHSSVYTEPGWGMRLYIPLK